MSGIESQAGASGGGVGVNGVHRTFRHAITAINAFARVDDEHVLAFIEAADRTHLHTVRVFASNAGLGNDKSHGAPELPATTGILLCLGDAGRVLSLQRPGTESLSPRFRS